MSRPLDERTRARLVPSPRDVVSALQGADATDASIYRSLACDYLGLAQALLRLANGPPVLLRRVDLKADEGGGCNE